MQQPTQQGQAIIEGFRYAAHEIAESYGKLLDSMEDGRMAE